MSNLVPRTRWSVVVALLGLAALVRVTAMFYHGISGDDATVALMAKHILHGEDFPAFFYRQSYMGSLNGFHLVPALWVFGPSALLVRLNAVAWSLLFPLGLYVLAERLYDEATARVTLLLAAVPPFLLTYYSTVAEPHFEANTFAVVLLLLAVVALKADTEPRRVRALGCLGFVAGLACWTNMKSVVVLGPILLGLMVHDPRLPIRRGGWLLAGGFLLGNLPAWLFYLTQMQPVPGSSGSARRFLGIEIDFSWNHVSEYLTQAVPLVGTYYWAHDTPLHLLALGLWGTIYAVAVALAGAEAIRALRRSAPDRRAWGLGIILLTLPVTYLALFFSRFNIEDDRSRGRYLLPAYVSLFLFLGAALARLSRRSRALAGTLLAGVVVFHLWTNLYFFWPLHPEERARRARRIAAERALEHRFRVTSADAVLTDGGALSFRWQFLLDRPIVSDLRSDNYYPSAVRADAAARVAILNPEDRGKMLAQLRVLGSDPISTQFDGQWLYERVDIPPRSYRLVAGTSWRSLGETAVPPAAVDGDLGTVWPPRRLDRSAAGELVLDLGASQAIARLILWPTAPIELIVPLEVSGSLDAVTWESLGVAPVEDGRPAYVVDGRPVFRRRNGWVELATAPRPVRYLRIRPAEPGSISVGMVGELRVYEELVGPPPERLNLDALVRVLRSRRVTRLLADPIASARVALATNGAVATLPANGALNSHGRIPPIRLFTPVRLRMMDAMLVAAEDAEDLLQRLSAGGVPATSEPIGAAVVIRPAGSLLTRARCRSTQWRVTQTTPDADGRGAVYVVEGRLPRAMPLATLRLEHPWVSTRLAALAGVEVSEDDVGWRAVTAPRVVPEWAWAGRTLFTLSGGATELAIGGLSARAVRVTVHLPYRGEDAITTLCLRGVS